MGGDDGYSDRQRYGKVRVQQMRWGEAVKLLAEDE